MVYPDVVISKLEGCNTAQEFEPKYGEKLRETDEVFTTIL